MEIKILNLYNDIMNLYGETGNLKVIEYHLKELGIKYKVTENSIENKLDIEKYDLIIIGSGTENNRLLCLKHLMNYKKDLKNAIENNKFFLVTGNSLGIFGKKIYNEDALGIFDYEVKKSKEQNSKEVILKNSFTKPIYGFVNNNDELLSNEENLFENEGIRKNNFFGTYTLGPILARNPEFLKYFLNEIIKSKNINCNINKLNTKMNEMAYDEFIEFKKNKQFNKNHS